MAVQVVSRWPDGRLKEWYDGDQRASHREAVQDARDLSGLFPGTPLSGT